MSFFNFLNTNSINYPSFGFNFSNWTLPSFNWNTPSWSNFSLNYSQNNNFTWNNNLDNTIGDTFTYTGINYPQYNFNRNYDFTTNQYPTVTLPTFAQSPSLTFSSKTYKNDLFTEKSNADFIKDYNASKGKKLAKTALNNSVGWSGYCAKYVKTAIEDVGLGQYESGHAYQMTDILEDNPNFKKVSTQNIKVDDLPTGCVLVYDKGVQGYSKDYGHVEITTGDGRGVSDGITHNLRKPSAVFIPV